MGAFLDIDDWRKEIDLIDEQLVELLNRRSTCAIEIGRIKRELGLPVYTPSREAEVINHVIGYSRGPLDAGAVRRLFERIIDESRRIERVIMEREAERSEATPKRPEKLRTERKKARGKRQS